MGVQKIYHRKDDFEILIWPYVTFNELWGHTNLIKKLRLYITSIPRDFYQNQFIKECARKKNAKIP